ncbi:hypothetical protein cyc_06627 [Cyclospora cayetanensis]|uniref:Uncharacterized protein n=1 Tax=Cyclospora cayetanensis TaxID=88456 RepID=A0A1D3CSD5_9EIME|nr:hypothetical protein cyc_06627 [Cyclospora cayetanensis]
MAPKLPSLAFCAHLMTFIWLVCLPALPFLQALSLASREEITGILGRTVLTIGCSCPGAKTGPPTRKPTRSICMNVQFANKPLAVSALHHSLCGRLRWGDSIDGYQETAFLLLHSESFSATDVAILLNTGGAIFGSTQWADPPRKLQTFPGLELPDAPFTAPLRAICNSPTPWSLVLSLGGFLCRLSVRNLSSHSLKKPWALLSFVTIVLASFIAVATVARGTASLELIG